LLFLISALISLVESRERLKVLFDAVDRSARRWAALAPSAPRLGACFVEIDANRQDRLAAVSPKFVCPHNMSIK
jgi:hypothetical protein